MEIKNPYPEFAVLGQKEAEDRVRADEPRKWNVVSIYSGDRGSKGGLIPLDAPKLHRARSIHAADFHDIDREDGSLILCNASHINGILKYAKEKRGEPLLVHCHAGWSRSAAMMFLILLDAFREEKLPVEKALGMVYANRPVCIPNRHIMHLGIKLLTHGDWLQEVCWTRELYNAADFKRIYG